LRLRPSIIYRGLLGSAPFQSLYAAEPSSVLMLCTTLEYHVLVTLPLWILSVVFTYLLPLAIASLALSLAVCAAAAAQAPLPANKKRHWSRPLVACLFFLQPIVRGWARYQGRLLQHPTPLAGQQTLDSEALRNSGASLKEADFWSTKPINRFEFVADILRLLEQQGWPHKADIGWSEFDVELYGSRWSNLQLTTVTEDQAPAKHLLRCRLCPRWSLAAKVAFWSLAGLELLALGFAGHRYPWLWLLLLTLPLLAWFLRREQRTLQSMLVVFLNNLARKWALTRQPPAQVNITTAQSTRSPNGKPPNASLTSAPAVEKEPARR
jgi:hypothetical protein